MQQKSFSLKCKKDEHEGQQMSYLCYDDQCEQKGIICTFCYFETHKSHTVEPLKYVIHEMYRDQMEASNNIMLLAKVDQCKSKLLDVVKGIKDQNLNNLLIMAIQLYFKDIQQKCQSTFYSEASQASPSKINSILLKYKQIFSAFDADEDKSISNQQKLIKTIIQELSEKQQALRDAIKHGKIDNSILGEFNIGESFLSKKFHFSDKFINSHLVYESQTKVKMTGYVDDWNYLVLCQPPLSSNKIQQCTFKMTNLSCYVTVGVSIKSKVENGYQIVTDGLGHGCYHMSYDGYSWSDSDSSVNNQYNSWYFNQNDKVTVEVNPKQKKIKFIKNGDLDHTHSIPYTVDKKEKLYFSVSFNSEPEEVDIVD